MWRWVVVVLVVLAGAEATGPRSAFVQRLDVDDFAGTEYYLAGSSSNGGGPPTMVEDLRRGHEGLMVKLHDVMRALKEDELKLNNVFFKLGRHETDLETVSSSVQRLTSSANKIEAKLNKHAFNVDFLRRRVERASERRGEEQSLEVQVATAREVIARLEDRLTDALARLGNVENTTRSLEKRSVAPHLPDLLDVAPALRPPTLTIFPSMHQGECAGEWVRLGLGCYWFGEEQLTFPEAMASCVRRGGHLLTLNPPGTHHDHLMARVVKGSSPSYWSCASDAFNNNDWTFLLTAQPVLASQWAADPGLTTHHCAALTHQGLVRLDCNTRQPYICHRI